MGLALRVASGTTAIARIFSAVSVVFWWARNQGVEKERKDDWDGFLPLGSSRFFRVYRLSAFPRASDCACDGGATRAAVAADDVQRR